MGGGGGGGGGNSDFKIFKKSDKNSKSTPSPVVLILHHTHSLPLINTKENVLKKL